MQHKSKRPPAAPTEQRNKDKRENIADFIAKKREMFLVQMSLDTKRAEIRKLEERAQMRERALRESEHMLEEDAMRFDAFLKENDMKAVDAIKAAEAETKAKNEKLQEIKKLNSQIAAIKSEMSKYEEQLEECREYKNFLDSLTPTDWFEEQKRKREAKIKAKEERRKAREEARRRALEAAEEGDEDDEGASPPPEIPSSSDEEEEIEDDAPMYFRYPEQLLDIFTELEESNLFLIQNSQETEEALEELKQKFAETKTRMDAQCESLVSQINTLKDQINVEETKARAYNNRTRKNADAEAEEHLLEELNAKVADVYVKCGFDSDAGLNTLQMLANIEARLEDYLRQIAVMPRELVEQAEKMKEKDRRRKMRDEKLQLQQKLQIERSKRAEARSRAPIQKKVGKQVMFRSPPLQKKRKEKTEGTKKEKDEEEDREFFM
eukprot:Rmarinus@m.10502